MPHTYSYSLVVRHPGAGGDELGHDDVLLETAQVVDSFGDGRFGEDAGVVEDDFTVSRLEAAPEDGGRLPPLLEPPQHE